MKKEDIINELSKRLLDKKQARDAVENILVIIKTGLEKDGKVTVSNFGVFTKTKTKPGVRHNPKTMEKVQVSSRNKIKFKPAPALLDN